MKDALRYINQYRDADLPFGVTYPEIARVTNKPLSFIQPLARVFDNGSATYARFSLLLIENSYARPLTRRLNALDFLCGLAVCCRGGVGDKINCAYCVGKCKYIVCHISQVSMGFAIIVPVTV